MIKLAMMIFAVAWVAAGVASIPVLCLIYNYAAKLEREAEAAINDEG